MAKKRPVKYVSRDFQDIKNSLVNHAKRYYPDSFKDFNEASFGSLMLDTIAYIGDNLSFYLDYQTNEGFLDSAIETKNINRLAKQLGYKTTGTSSTEGVITVYVLVPASTTARGVDEDYLPIIKRGSKFSAEGGGIFTLQEDIDLANPANEVVVAKVDATTGDPTYFAVKAKGRIISGELFTETIRVGDFNKFLKIKLDGAGISEVLSILDTEGNEYFEVAYLSQNVIYQQLENRASDKTSVPYSLKLKPVPRRFTVDFEDGETFIQFGFGSADNLTTDLVADPADVVLDVHGRTYVSDDSFDPSNLIKNDKFGVAPENTVLTVTYRANDAVTSNAAVNTVTTPVETDLVFKNRGALSDNIVEFILSTVECTNEEAIVGDVTEPDQEEIRTRAFDSYASQNRAVTKQDYIALCYRMPRGFGSIKRASISQDRDSFKRNLNLFVLSEDSNENFTLPSTTLLNNLKSWLNQYKMINDTIDIIPGKIINLSIDFEIVADIDVNKFDVINDCIAELRDEFGTKKNMGEPFYVSDVFRVLNRVPGVIDTVSVDVNAKTEAGYSQFPFDVDLNTSPDGKIISAPDNVVFEIRDFDQDVQGVAR